ncbi:MAG: radical SAM protein [Proteobacteria bacterium]|nr:radical SAM protein [Pseudomonadota bacterium]
MRIGILELMSAGAARRWDHMAYSYLVTKQYASIMPQAVSVWCRSLGHQVFYATYFGNQYPEKLLPNDLDVVFISTYTQASALAYALAKLYRKKNTLTVIGGPHAKQFPEDCLRFFDIVVGDCDKALITEILKDKPRGQILTSGRILQSVPGVEERIPEIRASTFLRGKPFAFTSIPLITSIGCPNSCDFCIDWNNPYVLLPLDQLEADMRYIFQHFPRVIIGLHDPNFAVKFEQVFDVLEKIPNRRRYRYVMEPSLSTLRGSRLERLKNIGNFYIIPGIECWTAYSNKVGAGSVTVPREKLNKVIEQLNIIRPYVTGIQANFIFGLDVDAGDEPIELAKEFASRVPFVMPNFNIPVPFGNTPLFEKYLGEDRLLTSMPFTFYYMPYLVFMLKNYSAATFYEKLIEIISYISSVNMRLKRLKNAPSPLSAGYNLAKALSNRPMIGRLRQILNLLKIDPQFRAFHEHETDVLPEYYHRQYEHLLGPYGTLMSHEERKPILDRQRKHDVSPGPEVAGIINR